ncbi:TPA: multidrug MFS transporter [Streptococcus pneumoniae]|uniref:Putative glycosyltransferase n=1 Tax=Streptococcus pneumoniae TaxID=1313 RepID=A0A4P8GCW3_STREE|nr:glycosyltransferase [Streptococcus pneumoniae]ASO97419.1 putative glycosyl transferase [Streptococcus pneumoniae]ASO97435.1 putative glycosyl transferase [Streptococcus pneumoniae]AUC46772.1 multidrug MFS transporter [Streptococcus pneumoniae]MDG7152284.1 glycosyltransferase [Streptococcus pneumoniae]MDG7260057.1 glycosyltransferase [Streptococcus pneumoniae]
MIFVTVGTHEQQFDRLIKEFDRLKEENLIQEEVFIQTGYSNYVPKYCKWEKIISYEKMNQFIEEADTIVTHGGPATFMAIIAKGKTPIVVPRQKKFGEHVNDHQMNFCSKISSEGYELSLINDISELQYSLKQEKKTKFYSNNANFLKQLSKIIEDLIV